MKISLLPLCLAIAVGLSSAPALAQPYTLVEGLEKFQGSTAAWNLLQSNGFVVADPSFKQIFQPYLAGPLPCYITPDSAWHAWRRLCEEGFEQLEAVQSHRLSNFSRALWQAATAQAKTGGQDFNDLANYAAAAIAIQDKFAWKTLPLAANRISSDLQNGSSTTDPGIGPPIPTDKFHPSSPNATSSEERSNYFAARQWYTSVLFRLSDPRETRLALSLAWLIAQDPDLLQQWQQLSAPYDALIGPVQDGTIPLYFDTAKILLGPGFTPSALPSRLSDLQQALAKSLPAPSGTNASQGFRLFPNHPLPGDFFFAAAGSEKIPNRPAPSGLDFMAATPELHSPAALRALRQLDGDQTATALEKIEPPSLPNSVSGEAIRLLAKLQQPLPASTPPVFRSAAWADQQLSTQLAAWSTLHHAGKLAFDDSAPDPDPAHLPDGLVAPYPSFFSGLANLSRAAASILQKNLAQKNFDPKGIARIILANLPVWKRSKMPDDTEANLEETQQAARFWVRYAAQQNYPGGPGGMVNPQGVFPGNAPGNIFDDLESLAHHCLTNTPTDTELKTLLLYHECDRYPPRLLNDFAAVCDHLSRLARKNLNGEEPTDDDQDWIRTYGQTLAQFEACSTGASGDFNDDSPGVARIFADADGTPSLYAGTARPQALYLILPSQGKLRLFCGAVLTYRELAHPATNIVDDDAWRDLVTHGPAHAALAFTHGFFAEKSAADLIANLHVTLYTDDSDGKPDPSNPSEFLVEQLKARASDSDLPALIRLLAESFRAPNQISELAAIIGDLHWSPYQAQLLEIIRKNPIPGAFQIVTGILTDKPENLDIASLTTNFSQEPPHLRRLYEVLLSAAPPTPSSLGVLTHALADPDAGVRWQAVLAFGSANFTNVALQKPALLLDRLDDKNEYVAAAAVYILGKIVARNTAPTLLEILQRRLAAPPPPESLKEQARAILSSPSNNNPGGDSGGVLDTDNLESRLSPEQMFLQRADPTATPFTLTDSLIETLGQFQYQVARQQIFALIPGAHDQSAIKAALQLDPETLALLLVTNATNRQAEPSVRDHYLALLPVAVATNYTSDLLPLLDDTTVVPHPSDFNPPPQEQARRARRAAQPAPWRICDRAAVALSPLFGGERQYLSPLMPLTQRDQYIKRVREMAQRNQPKPPTSE